MTEFVIATTGLSIVLCLLGIRSALERIGDKLVNISLRLEMWERRK